jgi:hypothetical protein
MADNYVQFSMAVAKLTVRERKWMKEELRGFYDQSVDDDAAADAFCSKWGLDDVEDWPTFDHEFNARDRSVVFYDDGQGNPDHLANFLRAFLENWRQDRCLGFEVAYTCSKARPGEFGGAAYWVTARGREVMSTLDWLEGKRRGS